MSRSVVLSLMAALFVLSAPALEAQDVDVSGDWTLTYTMQGRQGGQGPEVSMDVTFDQDGTTVTGTAVMAMRGPGGGGGEPQPVPLTDTGLDGDQLTFTVARTFGQRTIEFVFTGTVAGSTMEGTMTVNGPMARDPIPFTGTRKGG